MPTVTTKEFLQALYPEPVRPGKLLLRTQTNLGGKKRSYWLTTLAETCRKAHKYRPRRDVYYGVALHDAHRAKQIAGQLWPGVGWRSVVGSPDSAVAIPALWARIEVGSAGEGVQGRPPSRDAALQLLAAVPVPASAIVNTGDGLDVYWLLRHLWLFESDDDRRQASDLLARLQGALFSAAQARGWTIGLSADLARRLRLPGTLNHACTDAAVSVEHFPRVRVPGAGVDGDFRYGPGDFADLPEPPPEPADPAPLRQAEEPAGWAIVAFRPMYEGCGVLRYCFANQQSMTRKRWRELLKLLIRSAHGDLDGDRLCHRFSERHSGYNPAATEEAIEEARRSPRPPTCRKLGEHPGAYEDHCVVCPHLGRIESPLDLGRQDPPPSTPGVTELAEAAGGAMEGQATHGSDAAETTPCALPVEPRQIVVNAHEHEVNDQALAALAAGEPNLFELGGVLVHVIGAGGGKGDMSRPPGSSVVRPVQEARLREQLARHCGFVTAKKTEAGEVLRPAHPPRWTVRAIYSRGSWPELPPLQGLVECPVLRADGSVLQQPGYDRASGLFYAPSDTFHPVPEKPTSAEIDDALAQVREAVCDFPFKSEAHRAAWLSALLTPLARAAFEGPSPLNLIDANVRGAGKSLLADVCSTLLTGRSAPRMSYSRDEDELRKAITGIALEATRLVLIDNITGTFGSPTLDRALTAETWRDRRLGSNTQVSIPLSVTWYATGNNVILQGDTPRRCLHIRLESSFERPELRTDFRHPRLLGWLRAERPRLLPAALTLLRAYVVQGRPDQGLNGWGSFERWSDLVRSTIVWLGLPDPAATREDLETDADTETSFLHDLIHGLAELLAEMGGAATAKEIVEQLAKAPEDGFGLLRSALADLFPRLRKGDLPRSTLLAGTLRSNRGRVVRGAKIDLFSKSYKGVRWTVRKVATGE